MGAGKKEASEAKDDAIDDADADDVEVVYESVEAEEQPAAKSAPKKVKKVVVKKAE